MILVYCKHITPRHHYIFDYFFEDLIGLKYALTQDEAEFTGYTGPKFIYGDALHGDELVVGAHDILKESGTRRYDINIFHWEGLPVFFGIEDNQDLPFDPFAMAFYLVTRYEEYLPFQADEHGRFPASASLGYREGFLDKPLVDMIAARFRMVLLKYFPTLQVPEKRSRFIPTFDIDIAYAHLGKGISRAAAAWLKLLLTGSFADMKERALTMTGTMIDPYDNFAWQQDLTTQYGLESIYFTLLGDFAQYDRNTSYKNLRFRKLIELLSRNSEIGIHPSYQSFLSKDLLIKEKGRLEDITGQKVTRNRFHFLRLKFPESYRILSEAGIAHDYSLGFSTINGFRAGTFTPFYFYDLEREETENLLLHPFIFMDTAMIDHMKYDPETAISEIENFMDLSREYGGELIGTWHNYALSEKGQYEGWSSVLEAALEESFKPSL